MRHPVAASRFLTEPARQVPVVHECDLCVVGGSCTGLFAAIRAARLGAGVAVIEKFNCFGGVATAGLVNIWHSLHDTEGQRQIIAGLTAETLDRLRPRGAVADLPGHGFSLNTEELKIELDELALECGVTPFLHTLYAAPVVEDGRLTAVILENKDGRQAIRARMFLDATGDGDLALDLGIPPHPPEPLQPPTTCAKLLGLSTLGAFDWIGAVREHGSEFGLEPDWGWGIAIPGAPDLHLRADTHVFGVDPSRAGDLTHAEIEGRRKVRAVLDVLRKYGPPGSQVALASLAATLGVRGTPRLTASYRLTGDDLLFGRRFPDAIANGTYPVDMHHADGPGLTFRYLDGTEMVHGERGVPGVPGRWREVTAENPTCYQIPLGCLIPREVPNLLLAGRLIDTDRVAFSATRVMVNTNQTGEAAGVAAYLALDGNLPVQSLDPVRVRETLARGGSIVI